MLPDSRQELGEWLLAWFFSKWNAGDLLNGTGKEEFTLETEACSEPTANTICGS